jgi:3alpha(or 20beta)-hydroxysteroid dehydrogenase
MSSSTFAGKTVVITGGAGGIGAAAARRFLAESANVVLVDRDAAQLAAVAESLDGPLITVEADVSLEADVERYVATAVATFGGIDVFFNNAGVQARVRPLIEVPLDDFQRTFAVNVVGVFLGLKHVLPIMYARWAGSVINTSSIQGLEGSQGTAVYDSSKHAVTGLTKTAALESAPYGVRVNSIHPGPVETPMMVDMAEMRSPEEPAKAYDRIKSVIPLGRLAQPDDIVNLVAFLASDQAAYITGAQYRVDGGAGAAGRLAR